MSKDDKMVEAKKLIEEDKQQRSLEFSKELEALMKKYRIELRPQIVAIALN